MQRIRREDAQKYAFDWRDEPLLTVQPGETFEIETYDASTGYFRSPQDKADPARRPGYDRHPPLANPVAGPIWLNGSIVATGLISAGLTVLALISLRLGLYGRDKDN